MSLLESLEKADINGLSWNYKKAEGLDISHTTLLPLKLANKLFDDLQSNIEYYDGDLSKVKVFGKWHDIPRQQVAYGDAGRMYTFSGLSLPAREWSPTLKAVKDLVCKITDVEFNFVLINRYRNGSDHIGEHRDGESDLDPNVPIASLSLGQHRDFVLKHADVRKKGAYKRNVPLVKIQLKHGTLLLMNPPTNKYWYHSVPPRKNAPGVRINLTFRKLLS